MKRGSDRACAQYVPLNSSHFNAIQDNIAEYWLSSIKELAAISIQDKSFSTILNALLE